MNKKYLSKFHIKDKTVKAELARAHVMIVLLVITLMFVLSLATMADIVLDPLLTFIIIVLLAFVGLISLSVVVTLLKKR